MTRSQQIAKQFREVYLNGKWVTPTNLKEQVSDLTWQQANQSIGSLNSIAKILFHLHYYIEGVLQVLEGGSLDIKDKYSFDMEPILSQEDWEQLQERMWTNTEKFAQLLEKMPEEKLSSPFVDAKYGNYERNMDVLIEHGYYHLGQVVMLKKMILSTDNAS